MSPIIEPEVPYLGPIGHGFDNGHMIRIQGITAPIAKRFDVNLQCGEAEDVDVALHISVRLQQGYVARNSFENGAWCEEQGAGELPVGIGQRFEIILLNATDNYKVAINGQHFCEFPHRIHPRRISHLKIVGDVSLSLISFEGGDLSKETTSQQQAGYGGGGYYPPMQQPQQGYAGYGYPQGGIPPPPPPPGYQGQAQDSGFSDLLGTASEVIAGAIRSGMAEKLIGSLTGGNQQHPQQQPPQQPPQPQPAFQLPNLGGQGSVGGLGSVGSILGGLAESFLHPKQGPQGGHH